MDQVHTGTYVSLLAPEILTEPLATQERLPRIHYTKYLSLRIRTSDSSQLEKSKKKKRKERKEKKEKKEKKRKKGKEKKIKKMNYNINS